MPATGFLFGDTWDYYATADRLFKWTNESFQAALSGATITAAAARNGAAGLRITLAAQLATFNRILTKTVSPGDATTFVCGTAFRYSSRPTGSLARHHFLTAMSVGTPQVTFCINADGTISAYRNVGGGGGTLLATSSVALLAGNFYHLKAKVVIHASTGSISLWVNAALVLTFSGNTSATGAASWNVLCLGHPSTNDGGAVSISNADLDYDDLYLRDSDDAATWAGGVVRFDLTGQACIAQAGNGANVGYTPSTGTNHGNMVKDLLEDGDATYNAGDTVGQIDTYAMDDIPTTVGVAFVQSVDVCRKVDPGDRFTANVFRIGGVNYTGADRAPNQTYSHLLQPYDLSPASAGAWTAAEINAMEAGQTITL